VERQSNESRSVIRFELHMPRQIAPSSVFSKRLRQAREDTGLSQKELGILAGLDPFVASTRINRYEQGVHAADLATAKRLAKALGVPLAYLYADSDQHQEIFPAKSIEPS
jgi:transcriptional regulator with XRE-family HTH domain